MFKNKKIALAAPTGKAAKRMSEQSGMMALTIHKLLGPVFKGHGFEFMHKETFPLDVDIVILDEVSMIDVRLFESFLRAISPGTRLILIGDTYQLPPVGAGYVLRDMIESRVISCHELDIIKRQDPGLIIENCHAIKNGSDIYYSLKSSIQEAWQTMEDFAFLHVEDPLDIQQYIGEFICNAGEKHDRMRDIQVITPLREKTELGCKQLNTYLQKELNKSPAIAIGKKRQCVSISGR